MRPFEERVDTPCGKLGSDNAAICAALPVASSRASAVRAFVPAEQVGPVLYARACSREPGGAAGKPYVLLREALERTDRVAVVKVALRQREQLATLRVRDGVL